MEEYVVAAALLDTVALASCVALNWSRMWFADMHFGHLWLYVHPCHVYPVVLCVKQKDFGTVYPPVVVNPLCF